MRTNPQDEADVDEEPEFIIGKRCPNCRRINPPDMNICVFCGRRPVQWQPEFRNMIIVAIVIAFVLLLWHVAITSSLPPTPPTSTGRPINGPPAPVTD